MVGFGVDENAPRYPFVLPTLFYRNLERPWNLVLWPFKLALALSSWLAGLLVNSFEGENREGLKQGASETVRRVTSTLSQYAQQTYEDWGFGDDEIL